MGTLFAQIGLALSIGLAFGQDGSVAARVAGGDHPLNLLAVSDQYLVSTNNGYGIHYLQAFDMIRGEVTAKLELPSLWFGLAYESGHKLLAASDGRNGVYLVPFDSGEFGKPRLVEVHGCKFTAGLVVQDRHTAVVACNQNHQIVQFDLGTGDIRARMPTGEFPFALTMLPANRLAVSNWGEALVTVVDLMNSTEVAAIKVGSHPNQMLVLPGAKHLAVACSDSDSVSIISLENFREIRRIDLRPPSNNLKGVQPNALASGRGQLYVALSA